MRKKILVTGSRGFIGSHFVKAYKKTYDLITPTHKELDILDSDKLTRIWRNYKPNIVINFAAHRDANTAELQRGNKKGTAWQTNVEGVKNILDAAQKFGSFLVHISTDMVFSGAKTNPGPYKETDKPESDSSQLSWYGYTKAEGERILANKKNIAIIRIGNVTQPVYDPKLDYVGKIVYLHHKKKLYPLFFDQYLSLTWIPTLFEVVDKIIKTKKTGIYHATSKNTFTPYELGKHLIKKKLLKTSIDSYLATAANRYPKFGGLDGIRTSKGLGVSFKTWQEIVDSFTS